MPACERCRLARRSWRATAASAAACRPLRLRMYTTVPPPAMASTVTTTTGTTCSRAGGARCKTQCKQQLLGARPGRQVATPTQQRWEPLLRQAKMWKIYSTAKENPNDRAPQQPNRDPSTATKDPRTIAMVVELLEPPPASAACPPPPGGGGAGCCPAPGGGRGGGNASSSVLLRVYDTARHGMTGRERLPAQPAATPCAVHWQQGAWRLDSHGELTPPHPVCQLQTHQPIIAHLCQARGSAGSPAAALLMSGWPLPPPASPALQAVGPAGHAPAQGGKESRELRRQGLSVTGMSRACIQATAQRYPPMRCKPQHRQTVQTSGRLAAETAPTVCLAKQASNAHL